MYIKCLEICLVNEMNCDIHHSSSIRRTSNQHIQSIRQCYKLNILFYYSQFLYVTKISISSNKNLVVIPMIIEQVLSLDKVISLKCTYIVEI